jgi:hypothetical protein
MRPALAIVVLCAGCYQPLPGDGVVLCSPTGQACPDDYYCAPDGTCYRNGHMSAIDASVLTDGSSGDHGCIVDQQKACAGKNCGPVADGCGGMVDCGSCMPPRTCGGGGIAGICGCKDDGSACKNKQCGMVTNNCAQMVSCGSCTDPEMCGLNQPFVCDCASGRIGIDRFMSGAMHCFIPHGQMGCNGFTLETANRFFLYPKVGPGLLPLYRCIVGGVAGNYALSNDPNCEGLGTAEALIGYDGSGAVCGATPLYRVQNGSNYLSCDLVERNTLLQGGWLDAGITGYVWGN